MPIEKKRIGKATRPRHGLKACHAVLCTCRGLQGAIKREKQGARVHPSNNQEPKTKRKLAALRKAKEQPGQIGKSPYP